MVKNIKSPKVYIKNGDQFKNRPVPYYNFDAKLQRPQFSFLLFVRQSSKHYAFQSTRVFHIRLSIWMDRKVEVRLLSHFWLLVFRFLRAFVRLRLFP